MPLSDYKITDNNISQKGVVAAPDKLTGTANENKAIFDRLIREIIKGDINNIIDILAGSGGAGEIGAALTGVTGTTVQALLTSIKALIDACETSADATTALALKEDKTVTAEHIKTVTFNSDNGKFTFTHENDTTTVIDTALEKVATNWEYDADTQSLVLTLADGTTQSVSLSDFITETEFVDSDQIDFSVSGHTVTATIKSGCITDTMLSSALADTLSGYVTAAAGSATAAAASEENALTYKNAAETAKTAAETAKTAAETAKTNAETAAGNAQSSETAAEESATAAAASAETAETDAAKVSAAGVYGFTINSDGELVVTADTEEVANSFSLDADGHLIRTISGAEIILGDVKGDSGVGISSIAFKEADASGNNVYTITLTNGNTYDFTAPKGAQGDNGTTPTIDQTSKHWKIGTTDTGVVAEGQDGTDLLTASYTAAQRLTARVNIDSARQDYQTSVAGEIVTADCCDEGNAKVKIYGKTTLSGTPSPSTPATMTDSLTPATNGAIPSLIRRGKNLLDFTQTTNRQGTTSSITLLPNGVEWTGDYYIVFPVSLPAGAHYKFSPFPASQSMVVIYSDGTSANMWVSDFTPTKPVTALWAYKTNPSSVETVTITDICVELYDDFSGYVPYAGSQSIALSGIGKLGAVGDVKDYVEINGKTATVHHLTALIDSYNGESITTAYTSTTGELTTGATVRYVLDTPTTEDITLSEAVSTLNGVNNIWTANTLLPPQLEVQTPLNMKAYVDKAKAEIQNAIIALGGAL